MGVETEAVYVECSALASKNEPVAFIDSSFRQVINKESTYLSSSHSACWRKPSSVVTDELVSSIDSNLWWDKYCVFINVL
jgi:hypothetical protein